MGDGRRTRVLGRVREPIRLNRSVEDVVFRARLELNERVVPVVDERVVVAQDIYERVVVVRDRLGARGPRGK